MGWPATAVIRAPTSSLSSASVMKTPSLNSKTRIGSIGPPAGGKAIWWPSRPSRLSMPTRAMTSTIDSSGVRSGRAAWISCIRATHSSRGTPWNGSGWMASSSSSS